MMTENRRVLHGAGPSAPVLVVSGLGDLWEYLFATAIALRKRAGAAVAFASRQALPDVLAERAGGGFREALLLGVGLSADPARLGAAFRALRKAGTRVTMMGRYEGTTDVPEHRYLVNDTTLNWDLRARGLGGDLEFPLTSCAEENVLGYQIDKYHAEDILIHEFAHSIHLVGIVQVDPGINAELEALLENAKAKDLWWNTYRLTDIAEYWAEGVQDWFNVNAEMDHPDGKHNYVNTREELKERDPGLYEVLARYFPATDQQISKHKFVNECTKENSRTR